CLLLAAPAGAQGTSPTAVPCPPNTDSAALMELGYDQVEIFDFQRAIVYFSCAIEADPNNAEAYMNRGAAYTVIGQFQRAITDYDRTIALDPTYAKAYNNRGS